MENQDTQFKNEIEDIKLCLERLEKKAKGKEKIISEIEKLKQRVAVLEKQLHVRPQMQVA